MTTYDSLIAATQTTRMAVLLQTPEIHYYDWLFLFLGSIFHHCHSHFVYYVKCSTTCTELSWMQNPPNAIQFLQFGTMLHVCVWPVIIMKGACWRHYPLLKVIYWLFKQYSSFVCSNILEDHTASIFRLSELVKVDAQVIVLTKCYTEIQFIKRTYIYPC